MTFSDTIQGHWRKLIPAVPKPVKHRCHVPSDPEVQAIAAEGSEWVCGECRRIWKARQFGFWYGVSLYATRKYEMGGDSQ